MIKECDDCMSVSVCGKPETEVIMMAKQGMKRPERTHVKPRNDMSPVPEIQGKAKCGKRAANPIVSGTKGPQQKVFHTEKPISRACAEHGSDPTGDNMENDMPDAGL